MGKLTVGQFSPAEYRRNIFSATPGEGTTLAQLLDSAYWANVAYMLAPGSRIEVMPEDQSFFAELLVRDCGNGRATVAKLRYVDLDAEEVVGDSVKESDAEAKYKGLHKKWCVVRKTDGTIVTEGLENRPAAETWIATNGRPAAA